MGTRRCTWRRTTVTPRPARPFSSGEKPKARFSLTSREALLKGGQSGEPAVVPGQGSDSQLVVFASDEIEDLEMPPLKHGDQFPSLSASEIKLLQAWIDRGGAWNKAPAQVAGGGN